MSKEDNISNLIQDRKTALNLTWDQMAELTDIPKTTLKRLHKKICTPNIDTLLQLAIRLNASVDFLLGLAQEQCNDCNKCRYVYLVRLISELLKADISNLPENDGSITSDTPEVSNPSSTDIIT